MEQHFQGSDFIPLMQPHTPVNINGQEFYLIAKPVWERVVESYYKSKLEADERDLAQMDSTEEVKKRQQKEIPSRKELYTEDTTFSLILLGPSNFHTTQDICFLDRSNQCNVNFKLLRGYLNEQEKEIVKNDNYGVSLKIGSKKTFNSKSRGVYKLVFELDLLLGNLVELSISTSWRGYETNNSFKALDITECQVKLIELL